MGELLNVVQRPEVQVQRSKGPDVQMSRLEQRLNPTPGKGYKAEASQYISIVELSTVCLMDPCHIPSTVNGPALSLMAHSALVVDVTSASTALGKRDGSLDIFSHTPYDAPQSTPANDCAAPVWCTRLHTAAPILTSDRQCECTGRTPSSA